MTCQLLRLRARASTAWREGWSRTDSAHSSVAPFSASGCFSVAVVVMMRKWRGDYGRVGKAIIRGDKNFDRAPT
jgi:hypothetical protein